MSQDPAMVKAYMEGKDLYAVIAQSMYNNKYEDNLEFYPEGTELEIDGKKIICGNGKEYLYTVDEDNTLTIPYFYELDTSRGKNTPATSIQAGDRVFAESCELIVSSVSRNSNSVIISFEL